MTTVTMIRYYVTSNPNFESINTFIFLPNRNIMKITTLMHGRHHASVQVNDDSRLLRALASVGLAL